MDIQTMPRVDEQQMTALELSGRDLLARVESLQVTDEASLVQMNTYLNQSKAQQKLILPQLAEPKGWADKLHGWFCEIERRVLSPWKAVESIAKERIGDYTFEQMEKRRKESERLAEAARKKAKEDRDKEIAAAKAQGDKEAVKELKQAPIVMEMTSLPKTPEPPKLAGTTVAMDWDYMVVNINLIPRQWLIPKGVLPKEVQSNILAHVKRLGKAHGIPGIIVSLKPRVSNRAVNQ